MAESLKEKTAKGLLWGGLSNGLVQVIGAVFGIMLLRLLTPSDYGKVAVLIVFSNIASSLQESGFIAALINRKEPTQDEYNSVFWFNVLMSCSVYVLLWFASPLIADFYHEPILTSLARYLFLGFVITSFGTVQRAYLLGHLKVKESSIMSVVSLLLSNVIGVTMAYLGFAFWGLATQMVAYVAFVVILAWYYSPFRPTFKIDLRPAFSMFGFSCKLLVTNLFNQLNAQVFSVLLGRLYNTQVAGYYSNARKWDDMAINTVNGMMSGVSQPVLAKVVDDEGRYRTVFRKMLRFVSFVSFPCMLGLGLISKDFILITVGEKWADSAVMLSMLSVYGAFYPIQNLFSNMTVSMGRSGINMFCTISICVFVWVGLILMHPYGIYYMIGYFVLINMLWLFVWQYFAWRLFHLSLLDALKDVLPFFFLAFGVMCATWYITSPIDNIYLSLVSKIVIAALLYVGIAYVSGAVILRETMNYLTPKKTNG